MKTPLSPFEEIILAALKGAKGGVLTFEQLAELKVPPRKKAQDSRNKFAVHMRNLRQKTNLHIESAAGKGYRIVHD